MRTQSEYYPFCVCEIKQSSDLSSLSCLRSGPEPPHILTTKAVFRGLLVSMAHDCDCG